MSKKFGKMRMGECSCTENSTCRECCRTAPPYHFTPSTVMIGGVSKILPPRRDEHVLNGTLSRTATIATTMLLMLWAGYGQG
jgi:hypothetical protein